ncbi:MAG TPA: amidase [Chloroflexota bacterium]|nr:amidase [Chloroflexota bacterium]
MATELWEATASELARMVRTKQASPLEIVQALLARIDAVEERVQAWETIDRDGALKTAPDVRSAVDLPMRGVPVGIKDIYLTGGLRTTASFPPFASFVPDHEAEAVMRLRRAGCIVLGKAVTTQFALADPPRTRNPWNPERTPGGSSSGSAAAVAARMTPLALGSQTKGSVLRPAAYCGVVGFKPTFGRVSRRNVFPLAWSFDTVGWLCRSVEDGALALSVLAGHDPADPSSSGRPVDDYLAAYEAPRAKPPKLGLVTDFFERAQPGVREHVRTTARRFESAGAELVELKLPLDFDMVSAAHDVIMHSETAAVHRQLFQREKDGYAPNLRATIETGALIPAVSYVQAQRIRRRFRNAMAPVLAQVDALLTPTASNVAPSRETTGDTRFQALWTQLGLPAISLPSGLNEEGLPNAVQLAGRPFEESALLSVARWAEDVLGPMPAPPL